MKIIDCIQGSEEWFAAKLGVASASNFAKILAKPRKQGEGVRVTYMATLAAERIKRQREPGFCTSSMQWGIDTEPEAREKYEEREKVKVEQVGFCLLDRNIGCSPDGLVGKEGLLEIKCPDSPTHIVNTWNKRLPTAYIAQVQGQLWVTDRKWCDFVSFDPRIEDDPYWSIRVERDEAYINKLAIEVNTFVIELEEAVKKITKCPY